MLSEDEEESREDTKFVKRTPKSGGRAQRPRSINVGSQIISNPKLVKSLQNLDIGPRQILIRPSSCINIKLEENDKRIQIVQKSRIEIWLHKYLGIILALFSSLAFSFSSIVGRKISNKYHPYTVSLWTFQGILFPSMAILIFQTIVQKRDTNFWEICPLKSSRQAWKFSLVVIRGLCGAGIIVLKVHSQKYMSTADSTVITFSSPIFVLILAWICLNEKCAFIPSLSALCIFTGVVLITKPPWITGTKEFEKDLLIGCIFASSSMLLGAVIVIILRYIRSVNYAFITFIYGLIGSLASVVLCWWEDAFDLPNNFYHWMYAGGVVSLALTGHIFLTLALKYEEAGLISLIRPIEIIFIFGWQLWFLKAFPDWMRYSEIRKQFLIFKDFWLYSLLGAFVVLFGVVITITRKWISTLENDHRSCGILML